MTSSLPPRLHTSLTTRLTPTFPPRFPQSFPPRLHTRFPPRLPTSLPQRFPPRLTPKLTPRMPPNLPTRLYQQFPPGQYLRQSPLNFLQNIQSQFLLLILLVVCGFIFLVLFVLSDCYICCIRVIFIPKLPF